MAVDYGALNRNLTKLTISHFFFANAVKPVKCLLDRALRGDPGEMILLLGEAGCGKTRLISILTQGMRPKRTPEGLRGKVLSLTLARRPSLKAVTSALLSELGDPFAFGRDSEAAKSYRVARLIKETGIRVVIIDELQHIATGDAQAADVGDWLKRLIDETGTSFIGAGLPQTRRVLDVNEQLRRRNLAPIWLYRYNWEINEHRSAFSSMLKQFQAELSSLDLPDLHSADWVFRIYCATGGVPGYVCRLLRGVVDIVALKGERSASLQEFNDAYRTFIVDGSESLLSPFTRAFDGRMTAEAMKQARLIGRAHSPAS